MNKHSRKFAPEHIQFVKENITGNHYKDVADMFCKKFGIELSKNQIIGLVRRNNLHNGIKGNKYCYLNGMKTRIKKGDKPWNNKPLGSEKITFGIVRIKVADPRVYKAKHVLIWESIHGNVPKNHVVIFADGNRNNFDIDNLLLVKRSELLVMNNRKYITSDPELTKLGKQISGLILSVSKRKKNERD